MDVVISRLLWVIVLVVALSYAVYLIAGDIVHAQGSQENEAVLIRDELGAGVHHLSGMIMVASLCDQLSVRTEALADHAYALVFRTWREPSMECTDEEVPRYFRTQLFAPSTGITLIATLDGHSFPIVVLPILPDEIHTDL